MPAASWIVCISPSSSALTWNRSMSMLRMTIGRSTTSALIAGIK